MMKRFVLCGTYALVVVLPTLADDWPQWRGPNRDGASKETGLLQQWPAGGPKLLWKATDLGAGPAYSTPSIANGQVYLLGSPDGSTEHVIALSERDGKQVWSTAIGRVGPNRGPQYPGPRSTPTVDGDRLYALASDGELACLDTKGKIVWRVHLRADFGGQPGAWAYAESPLVDGDAVVCSPGGKKATMVALNKTDGKLIWQCPIPGGDPAAYASVVIAEAGGVRQYVQFLGRGVVGVEAKTGRFLWRYDETSNGVTNIATPLVRDADVFSVASKQGAGLVKLAANGGTVTATKVYFTSKLQTHVGGVVRIGDNVYGTTGQKLVCLDFNTGKVHWENSSLGKGSLCYADGRVYLRSEDTGAVALVEATPTGYKEHGRFTPPDRSQKKAWPYPVVANGCLYLRDQAVLHCYDVKGHKP